MGSIRVSIRETPCLHFGGWDLFGTYLSRSVTGYDRYSGELLSLLKTPKLMVHALRNRDLTWVQSMARQVVLNTLGPTKRSVSKTNGQSLG